LERKLAAILAADVVGYSRLMAANEAETLGGVDGFDQDEACCQGDEGGEVPLRLLAA
jgi:class 3 adenylate cyclase